MAVQAAIGVSGQQVALDPWLTGRENLRLMADLHHLPRREGIERVNRLLADFGLEDAADRPVMTYSGGMQRRLDLAMTLLGQPRILFLDEPTTGLDPRSRRQLWDDIHGLVTTGVTVFLTAQYLEEADALADRIALLDKGKLVAHGTPAELKALVPGGHVHIVFDDSACLDRAARALASASCTIDEENLSLQIPSDATVGFLRAALHNVQLPDDARVTLVQPDLDDVFLTLTGAAR